MSGLRARFSSGFAWTFLGNVSWKALNILSVILVARILGVQSFGEFALIRNTVAMVSVYAGLGLGGTSTRYIAAFRLTDRKRAARVLTLATMVAFVSCTATTLVYIFASPFLVTYIFNRSNLILPVALSGLIILFVVFGDVLQGAAAGFERFRDLAYIAASQGVLTLLICVPMTYYWGLLGAVGGLVTISAIVLPFCAIVLARARQNAGFTARVSVSEAYREIPILWQFALPGILTGAVISGAEWFGRLLLTRQEDGFSELGVFAVADSWRAMVLFLPAVLTRVSLPILSERLTNNLTDFRNASTLHFQAVCLLSLPIVILVTGLAQPLAAVFGREYSASRSVIQVIMVSVYFLSLNQAIRQTFHATGRRWTNLFLYSVFGITLVSASLFLVPVYKALGLAFSFALAQLLVFVVQFWYSDSFLLAKGLRRHWSLIIYSLIVIGLTNASLHYLSYPSGYAACAGMFILSVIPIFRKMSQYVK